MMALLAEAFFVVHTRSMRCSGFDWDDGNREKCRKHGVPIVDIEFVLRNEPHVAPDPKHSQNEDRFIAVGLNSSGRALFVAFTLREDGRFIRPISARYMHAKERAAYADEGSQTDK